MALLINGRPPGAFWSSFAGSEILPMAGGLINQTYQVGTPPLAVLQRLHSIFPLEVNEDIHAITAFLSERGMTTPLLLPCDEGSLGVTDEEGRCWRALSWLDGDTYHEVNSPELAFGAGALVGRWHRALEGFEHSFAFSRMGVHDTDAHMGRMWTALKEHTDHRLRERVMPLVEAVQREWEKWEGRVDLPSRLCHGDLKISNLLFSPGSTQGLCLVDLDTMSYLSLDVELGDAWRSWCNQVGEDVGETQFDLEIFEASAKGFLQEVPVAKEIRETLPAGVERICLELTSRFLADALNENYFGWDSQRAPTRGEHNLLRAQGQLALARSARSLRGEMESLLGV
jgi:Ser/Thr protein kinase RdoA (MazF antagonist)